MERPNFHILKIEDQFRIIIERDRQKRNGN